MALVKQYFGALAPQKAFYALILMGLFAVTLSSCGAAPAMTGLSAQEGIASYYSNDFQGHKTSSGELFDNGQMTAAHRSFPFGTIVRVTNLKNSEQVEVRINDRGPRKPERIIDLSLAAARSINMERDGLAHVRIEILQLGS